MLRALQVIHVCSPYIVLSIATGVLITTSSTQPAAAQGFFEQLFGVSKPKPRVVNRPRRSTRRPIQLRTPSGGPLSGLFGQQPRVSTKPKRTYSPRYRTVCVRMCDGYYFPISFSTRRGRMGRDARVCERRCPGQGKLFYMRSPSGTIKSAVDLQGRKYAKLDIALKYRRKLVPNCACRPAPWSPEERLRHAMYDRGGDEGDGGVVAGRYARTEAGGGQAARTSVTAGVVVIAGGVRLRSTLGAAGPAKSAETNPQDAADQSEASHPLATFNEGPSVGEASSETRSESHTAAATAKPTAKRTRKKHRTRKVKSRRTPKVQPALFGGGSALRFPGD
ncbi:MAG: DUF2865 domain-containing protein [Pseudomonadota bacterium]